MRRRQCQRYKKRLETTFSSGILSCRGITSDLSPGGLFIRSQHGFVPGTLIDIDIFLPNNKVSHLKGIVRRTVKTTMTGVKNGMGIELIERDSNYLEFLRTVYTEGEELRKSETVSIESKENECNDNSDDDIKKDESPEFILVTCDKCKVKNKVPFNRKFGIKCGKCGTPLKIGEQD